MKKLLIIVVGALLVFSMSSCGKKDITQNEIPDVKEKIVIDEPLEEDLIEADYDMSLLRRIEDGNCCYYIPKDVDYMETEYQQAAGCGEFGILSTFATEYSEGDPAKLLGGTFKNVPVNKINGGAYVICNKDGKSMGYFLHIGPEGGQIIQIFTGTEDVEKYCKMIFGTFGYTDEWKEENYEQGLTLLCDYSKDMELEESDFELAGDVFDYTKFAVECMLEGKF